MARLAAACALLLAAAACRSPSPEALRAAGERAWTRHRCVACHGADGRRPHDATAGDARFPSDRELRAWIEHPSAVRPGARMPGFRGIVEPEEWEPLLAHVRSLARR